MEVESLMFVIPAAMNEMLPSTDIHRSRNYKQTGELKYLDAVKALLLSGVEDKEFAKTVENLALSRVIYDKQIPSDDACYESALQEITVTSYSPVIRLSNAIEY